MKTNICPCAHCWSGTNGKEAHEIAREMRERKGLPENAPLNRWVWLQGGDLCECAICRRMGEENNIHIDNVNDKMKKPSFEHNGRWIPQYWCVGSLWG